MSDPMQSVAKGKTPMAAASDRASRSFNCEKCSELIASTEANSRAPGAASGHLAAMLNKGYSVDAAKGKDGLKLSLGPQNHKSDVPTPQPPRGAGANRLIESGLEFEPPTSHRHHEKSAGLEYSSVSKPAKRARFDPTEWHPKVGTLPGNSLTTHRLPQVDRGTQFLWQNILGNDPSYYVYNYVGPKREDLSLGQLSLGLGPSASNPSNLHQNIVTSDMLNEWSPIANLENNTDFSSGSSVDSNDVDEHLDLELKL